MAVIGTGIAPQNQSAQKGQPDDNIGWMPSDGFRQIRTDLLSGINGFPCHARRRRRLPSRHYDECGGAPTRAVSSFRSREKAEEGVGKPVLP